MFIILAALTVRDTAFCKALSARLRHSESSNTDIIILMAASGTLLVSIVKKAINNLIFPWRPLYPQIAE